MCHWLHWLRTLGGYYRTQKPPESQSPGIQGTKAWGDDYLVNSNRKENLGTESEFLDGHSVLITSCPHMSIEPVAATEDTGHRELYTELGRDEGVTHTHPLIVVAVASSVHPLIELSCTPTSVHICTWI